MRITLPKGDQEKLIQAGFFRVGIGNGIASASAFPSTTWERGGKPRGKAYPFERASLLFVMVVVVVMVAMAVPAMGQGRSKAGERENRQAREESKWFHTGNDS